MFIVAAIVVPDLALADGHRIGGIARKTSAHRVVALGEKRLPPRVVHQPVIAMPSSVLT